MNEAARFFDGLFPLEFDYQEGGRVALYGLPSKATQCFRPGDREGLLSATEFFAARGACYVHVALHDPELIAPGGRGSADSAVALAGLFDDIDIALEGHRHKSEALPATLEDAQSLLAALPWRPSMIVHTGFGLQPWWLFREPLSLVDPEGRAAAVALLARYRLLRDRLAAERGWKLDAVHDLARVLRVPGTRNLKNPDAVREVRLLEVDGPRYNPMELLDALPPLEDFPHFANGPGLAGDALSAQTRALLAAARSRAFGIGRNPAGLWLACQLRDAGLPQDEALAAGAPYTAFVDRLWPERRYGFGREYEGSVAQAFRRPPRGALPTLADLLSVDLIGSARDKTLRKLARELYFHRLDDPLVVALVAMLNEARCKPGLGAGELATILEEEEAGVAERRTRKAS